MQRDIFISYSRTDLELVKQIKLEIEKSIVGVNCWMDLSGIESGAQFEDVIINAICSSKVVLFMMSANSMQSEWALDELDFARRENKRVVLVNIDNSEMTRKFYFRYHKFDTILWTNAYQRDKLIKDLKSWLGNTSEEFQKYLKLAKAYLSQKERVNYYETKAIYDEYPGYTYMLAPLEDDEVKQIRAIKEKYGEDFVNHLIEIFEDPDIVSDLFYGEPVDIDLETVYHKYRFTVHEIREEGKVFTLSILLQLSDEDYAKLLACYLFDEHLIINTLLYRDEALYNLITRKVLYHLSDHGFLMYTSPYTITMDEAHEDSKKIAEENNIPRGEGYRWLGI